MWITPEWRLMGIDVEGEVRPGQENTLVDLARVEL